MTLDSDRAHLVEMLENMADGLERDGQLDRAANLRAIAAEVGELPLAEDLELRPDAFSDWPWMQEQIRKKFVEDARIAIHLSRRFHTDAAGTHIVETTQFPEVES